MCGSGGESAKGVSNGGPTVQWRAEGSKLICVTDPQSGSTVSSSTGRERADGAPGRVLRCGVGGEFLDLVMEDTNPDMGKSSPREIVMEMEQTQAGGTQTASVKTPNEPDARSVYTTSDQDDAEITDVTYQCPHCGQQFTRASKIRVHTCKTKQTAAKSSHKGTPETAVNVCGLCGSVFSTKRGLRIHTKKKHTLKISDSLVCNNCGQYFLETDDVHNHECPY